MNGIYLLADRDEQTVSRLVEIWESAVKETHTFLSAVDILEIESDACQGIKTIEHLYGYSDDKGVLQGFVGVGDQKIEMLFIESSARGCGIGKRLLCHAIEMGAKYVDVNEQNEQGLGFYLHMGFHAVGRSECDEQGRPFPLLHLEL